MTDMPKKNDIFLANKNSTISTTLCTTNRHPPTQMAEEWREVDYWDSGEAIKLFNPTLGKSLKQCCGNILHWLMTDMIE
jgi:hypothetical protein